MQVMIPLLHFPTDECAVGAFDPSGVHFREKVGVSSRV